MNAMSEPSGLWELTLLDPDPPLELTGSLAVGDIVTVALALQEHVLMLNPLVDLFQHVSHGETLERYDEVVNKAIQQIVDNERDATPDDAFVVRSVIRKEVTRRNKIQAAVDGIMRLRRRKKKRKAKKK